MSASPARPVWPKVLGVVVVLLIVAGACLTSYFGFRFLRTMAQLRHEHAAGATDVSLIRGWMTIPFIARAYRVPEDTLWQGLGISPEGNRTKNLRLLSREYAGGQEQAFLDRVRELVRLAEQTPSPNATPPPP